MKEVNGTRIDKSKVALVVGARVAPGIRWLLPPPVNVHWVA